MKLLAALGIAILAILLSVWIRETWPTITRSDFEWSL